MATAKVTVDFLTVAELKNLGISSADLEKMKKDQERSTTVPCHNCWTCECEHPNEQDRTCCGKCGKARSQ